VVEPARPISPDKAPIISCIDWACEVIPSAALLLAKSKHDVQVKRQFSPAQMRDLARNYQKTIRGIGIPDDPWLQLTGAVEMVLDSWNTPKTKEYRALMDVSDSWGTAVIIQAMVFGNKKKENFDAFVESLEMTKSIVGKGIGVSGSALAGRAVFSVANINRLRREKPGTPLILIRQDTVPEDIKEISQADGLLTARGGQTSHASLVALRLDKTCVVGCKNLKVYESEERCEIGGHIIRCGDPISIDGRKGLFLRGMHPLKEEVHNLPI